MEVPSSLVGVPKRLERMAVHNRTGVRHRPAFLVAMLRKKPAATLEVGSIYYVDSTYTLLHVQPVTWQPSKLSDISRRRIILIGYLDSWDQRCRGRNESAYVGLWIEVPTHAHRH